MKLERLISIIYKLLNHDVLSASKLAEEFQVSQRTIYRDIDAICAAGFPVVSYQGTNGGYGMIDGYKMDRTLLGSYDVNTLITVLQGLSTVFEDERVNGTIERLQTIGPEHRTMNLSVDFENLQTDPEALRQLREAITERHVVRFDYINANNERLTRHIEPLRLHFKHRNWYVYGYCRVRQDYREFRLSRMLNFTRTQDIFEPHPEMLNEAAEAAVSEQQQQDQWKEVVLQVKPDALAEVMDQFRQGDKQFHPDGSMTIRIPVHEPLKARWLRSILLSFGSGVEVLEPTELRGVLREALHNTLKLYEEV
ncbi:MULTISPECIES: helix-turn-helix transcriptional regulator [Paenibacillus]|uniref:Transcriptional regulator n=1 Tax=Paenibacillus campinasensis TaxID=66347 RepID=A0A268EU38_9BACL|nr:MULTISPECIES: YafY family protein [Paenibacillus]MUG67412.1 WYL domain-containing protein [Paenibacillus campinasensis]PAD76594.1 transcriptional regulator [Paenibacillus campinasensis]PAK55635.1 transcriptional regulator [Paenibacillus sp. 7541]